MNYSEFLSIFKLRASDVDIQFLIDQFKSEMEKGLKGETSSLRMIPTYIEAENDFLINKSVLAIDAGGTNFRATLMTLHEGQLEFSDLVQAQMPGLDGEISKDEFFKTIAQHIKPLAEKVGRIGFCFSYPTEILPSKDGILLQFCKEVRAPEVVGQLIGKSLLETLGMPDKPIVLLNDTVATLLAGKSASFGKSYDSYIGYILGTGTNTCYIESNSNIIKNKELDNSKTQIINIESGNFGKAPRTEADLGFDITTTDPGSYTFEKMISGGYFGGLCLFVLKTAASLSVFSSESAERIKDIDQLTTEQVNDFIDDAASDSGPLKACIQTKEDEICIKEIIKSLIDRTAILVAANLAAVILKTNKGKSADKPILITIEGTTFYKLYQLKSLVKKYLAIYFSGENRRYVEYANVAQSSLVGAGLAALIE
jgi:hexokinase